uniref:Phlebovirus glycoprotein G2 fusion domain-containing protein n=1 Tax=Acrobeloides nanus TaxID=290746 RepID=A0A914EMZ4_9BILA
MLTAEEHSCRLLSNNGTLACTIDQSAILSVLPRGQEICLLITYKNLTYGYINLRFHHLASTCNAKLEYYTRSYSIRTASSKRCWKAGSCSGDYCDKVGPNTQIPELESFKNYTGHSSCYSSGGGLYHSCFWSHTACLFSRIYAIPLTDDVSSVTSCPTWDIRVHLGISIVINDHQEDGHIKLRPGLTSSFNKIRATLISNSIPPTPLLGKKFLSDGTRIVVVEASAAGSPIVGQIGDLQCRNKEAASRMDCYFPRSVKSLL